MRTKPCKTQYVVLRVRFDKPTTSKQAYQSIKDTLQGQDFYTMAYRDSDPEQFKIAKVISRGAV